MSVTIAKMIAYYLQFWIVFLFFYFLLPLRYGLKKTILLTNLFAAISLAVGLLPELAWYRSILALGSIGLIPIFIFTGKKLRRLIFYLIAFFVQVICEFFISTFVFGTDVMANIKTGSVLTAIQVYTAFTLSQFFFTVLLAVILRRVLSKRDGSSDYDSGWFYYLLLSIVPVAVTFTWYRYVILNISDTKPVETFLPIVLCLIIELSVALLQRSITQKSVKDGELHRMAGLIEAQPRYYSALIQSYNSTRKLRHDLGNHIYTINALLADDKIDEAKSYANEVTELFEKSRTARYCKNSILDSFLYYRAESIRGSGIDLQISCDVSEDIGISSTDLIGAFGNLLDNAEEACFGRENMYIKLGAYEKKGHLIIETANPALVNEKNTKKERIPGLSRGIGNTVLNDIASRYDGSFSGEESKDEPYEYRAVLVLKENENA